MTCNIT